MTTALLFYIFVAVTLLQISYFIGFSFFVFSKESKKKKNKNIPISVIVCAKNEAENLQKLLPYILEQNYPDFEIILINDASSDNTLEVMEEFQQQNKRIKIVDVKGNETFWGNKKYALTLGIKAAKNEHLLFTDADCELSSTSWISEMTCHFSDQKTIILGYGKYKKTLKSWVNLLVRFETLITAVQYFSYAKLGSPYMAVGRNFAYTKSAFFQTNGFSKHMQLKSGDDDLFIRDAATKSNVAICTSKNSFTISEAPTTLKSWFQQKRRHVSTASHYKKKHQLLLGLYFVSKVLFYSFSTLLFFSYPWQHILPWVLLYFSTQYIVIGFAAKKLDEKQVLYALPFLEVFLMLFQLTIFITNSFSKPTHWK